MYARRATYSKARLPAALFERDFSLATLGADATFTRASTAYVTDYQGVLREVPIDTPRFAGARWTGSEWSALTPEGSPITGIQYLNEPGSTNYFLNSFAPATQSVTQTGTHTVSCKGTGSVVLSGGLTGTVTEGNPITGDPGGTAVLCTCSGTLTYVQFEPGSVATSPISTTGSPVSRAADGLVYSFGAGNFPQNFAIAVDFEMLSDAINTPTAGIRFFGSDDSRGNSYEIRTYGSTTTVPEYSGGLVFNHTRTAFPKGPGKAVYVGRDLLQIYINGAQKYSAARTVAPDHTNTGNLGVGHWIGGEVIPAKFNGIAIYDAPLSATQLKRLSLR